jgi:hypothetical protein
MPKNGKSRPVESDDQLQPLEGELDVSSPEILDTDADGMFHVIDEHVRTLLLKTTTRTNPGIFQREVEQESDSAEDD